MNRFRQFLSVALLPKYVYYRLHNMKSDYGFGFRYKANQVNAGSVDVPVRSARAKHSTWNISGSTSNEPT